MVFLYMVLPVGSPYIKFPLAHFPQAPFSTLPRKGVLPSPILISALAQVQCDGNSLSLSFIFPV